jgi:cyclopropane fatty-acyl-phospholipid synthase-like methyltransferase
MENQTLNYYNDNASSFLEGTQNASMFEALEEFIQFIPSGGKVLDFGCGAGRDSKFLLEQGFLVDAVDGSKELCQAATYFTGVQVKQMDFLDINEILTYDGIWACASILHLSYQSLPVMFEKLLQALKKNGILYVSFKYGSFEGMRNGRYFTDMTEEKISGILEKISGFIILKQWISSDVRAGREGEKWLNLILRKID